MWWIELIEDGLAILQSEAIGIEREHQHSFDESEALAKSAPKRRDRPR